MARHEEGGRTTLFTMRWRRIACLSLWGFSIGLEKEVAIKYQGTVVGGLGRGGLVTGD